MPRRMEGGPTPIVGSLPPTPETVRVLRDDPACSVIVTAVIKAAARDLIAAQPGPVRAALEERWPAELRQTWGLDDWVACLFECGQIAAREADRAGS